MRDEYTKFQKLALKNNKILTFQMRFYSKNQFHWGPIIKDVIFSPIIDMIHYRSQVVLSLMQKIGKMMILLLRLPAHFFCLFISSMKHDYGSWIPHYVCIHAQEGRSLGQQPLHKLITA